MDAFTTLDGLVAPLDRANVDTDQIIPKQYLKSIKRTGFGDYLFDAWRFLDQGTMGMTPNERQINREFSLNLPEYQGASILVARDNFEKVYDVACADGGSVDPDTHRCPDNGATVDLGNCAISPNLGAGELKARWVDPDFNPAHRAFYYVRALENPTCRWSTWDALRAGVAPREDLQATIQERVWSSAIWYQPAQS